MNIMVPIVDINQLEMYITAGADEFYFGLYDRYWEEKYGVFEEINRMSSFASIANVNICMAERLIYEIKKNRKKAFLALNSAHYSGEQKKYLMSLLAHKEYSLLDGIIIGDFSMIDIVKSLGYKVTISTMGGVYNSDIVKFYKKNGADRIIFPRDMKINDIQRIVDKCTDIKYEVFLMRNGCKYSDAYCMAYHAREFGSMCLNIDTEKPVVCWNNNAILNDDYKREFYENNKLFTKAFHKQACGLCAIDKFKEMGIDSVKIVGRADNMKNIVKDIELVRDRIENNLIDESQYENCLYGLNCYYKNC